MLRKLLTDKIDLEPVGSGRDRGYKFRGSLAIDRIISGDTGGTHLAVGGPNGIRPRVCGSPRFRQRWLGLFSTLGNALSLNAQSVATSARAIYARESSCTDINGTVASSLFMHVGPRSLCT